MPSTAVADMSHEFLSHPPRLRRLLQHRIQALCAPRPRVRPDPHQAATGRPDRLLTTLRLAREDENCWPELPIIFLVDHHVRLAGAHRYLADCGGRGMRNYVSTPGLVCLHHLAGMDRPPKLPRGPGNVRAIVWSGWNS
jgi:hypothetical protein